MFNNNMKKEIKPNKKGYLKVDDIHKIYWEQWGNPNGIPVVYLHGGPGGSFSYSSTRFFNLKKYCVTLFDQRGCGKSQPKFSLKNNTTQNLIEDINKLRIFLKIEKWLVFGGSWGSTLGLAYAIKYFNNVTGLILRGIFLGRPKDWDWLIESNGIAQMFPEKYNMFIKNIPLEKQKNIKEWYYKKLNSKNKNEQIIFGTQWSKWETSLLFFNKEINFTSNPKDDYQIALMECHYAINNTFFDDENYILNNVHLIKNKPCWLIHGEFDYICPPSNAYELNKKMKNSKLIYVKNSGHSSSEPKIFKTLKKVTNEFVNLIKVF
ncbi:prolyl aminopeptidase [Mycoplasmoides pirum]|uniref:prolyl aminopeptidase n=1 Tax=Mycoplasmoides pirum TaxID=2122 RepID=UPI0004819491|nr:prolyl aminopeptidase [Mycoplasmoides pirum]